MSMDQDTSQNGDGARADLLREILGAGLAAKDAVVRMAREAGFRTGVVHGQDGAQAYQLVEPIGNGCAVELARFADLVRADERERCAKVAERMPRLTAARMGLDIQDACAAAIRARSQQ